MAPEQHEFRAKSPLSKLSVLTRVSRRTHKVGQYLITLFNLKITKQRRQYGVVEKKLPLILEMKIPFLHEQ